MSDPFPPNSHRSKAGPPEMEPKKIERITSGEVARGKRGLGRRFKETFFGGDLKTAAALAASAVVIPAIQDMVGEFFHTMVDNTIHGTERKTAYRRQSSSVPGGYGNVQPQINYSGMSTKPAAKVEQGGRTLSRSARSRHDFADIVIQDRREAEEVHERLYDLLSRYGSVAVADLYELTGIVSSHTDHKWGWTDLRGSRVLPLRGNQGYLLDLPEPQIFD